VNAADTGGVTALHEAAGYGETQVVARLLDHDADARIARRKDGATALHYAIARRHVAAAKQLFLHYEPLFAKKTGEDELQQGLTDCFFSAAKDCAWLLEWHAQHSRLALHDFPWMVVTARNVERDGTMETVVALVVVALGGHNRGAGFVYAWSGVMLMLISVCALMTGAAQFVWLVLWSCWVRFVAAVMMVCAHAHSAAVAVLRACASATMRAAHAVASAAAAAQRSWQDAVTRRTAVPAQQLPVVVWETSSDASSSTSSDAALLSSSSDEAEELAYPAHHVAQGELQRRAASAVQQRRKRKARKQRRRRGSRRDGCCCDRASPG
jgi:hypothetical protein